MNFFNSISCGNDPPPKADVIVYIHNDFAKARMSLEALFKYSLGCSIFLIKEKRLDGDLSHYLYSFKDKCVLLEEPKDSGRVQAVTKAIENSSGKYIAVLDSNAVVTPYWLENMLECMQADGDTGMVVPVSNKDFNLDFMEKNLSLEMRSLLVENASCRSFPVIDFPPSSCVMIKRNIFKNKGALSGDYLLRIKRGGFKSRVADHAYVFFQDREPFAGQTRSSLRDIEDRIKCLYTSVSMGFMKDMTRKPVVFLMPTAERTGGIRAMIQEARILKECGFNIRVLYKESCLHQFLFYYLETMDFAYTYSDFEELKAMIGPEDLVISTSFGSAEDLEQLSRIYPLLTPVYYVHDDETCLRIKNVSSRAFFCSKTPELCRMTGPSSGRIFKIDPGLDKNIYNQFNVRNRVSSRSKIRIVAMVQPSISRYALRETFEILGDIKDKFLDKVNIRIFGCRTKDLNMKVDSPRPHFKNFGVLQRSEMAWLLKETDIFIDLLDDHSFNQNALEAMAAGCATILLKNNGAREYARDRDNCFLVEAVNRKKIGAIIDELVCHEDFLNHIKQAGIKEGQTHSAKKSVWAEISLFDHIYTNTALYEKN